MRSPSFAVIILTATALTRLASAQLINGGFEDPAQGFRSVLAGQSYGSWTATGPNDIEFVRAESNALLPGLEFSAYEGEYWIDLVGIGAPSGIYQDLVTTPSRQYRITFALAGNVWGPDMNMSMEVLWNGTIAASFSHDVTGRTGQDMGWTLHTVDVLATGVDRLTFRGTSGSLAAGAAIDAVSIQAIPAPAAAVPLFACATILARRRR